MAYIYPDFNAHHVFASIQPLMQVHLGTSICKLVSQEDSFCLPILSKLLYLAFSANLGLLCMPHPGMGPLV